MQLGCMRINCQQNTVLVDEIATRDHFGGVRALSSSQL
jgi:hypothetical protein